MRIWTPAYRPFIMGGNVNAPLYLDADPVETRTIRGRKLHLFTDGTKTVVVEDESGGTVADTFESAQADLEVANLDMVKRQAVAAKKLGDTAEKAADAAEWWSHIPA